MAVQDLDRFSELVAEGLQGSCMNTIEQVVESVIEHNTDHNEWEGLTQDDIDWHVFDNLIFSCADCGWWCESSEQAPDVTEGGEQVCQSCWEENHVVRCQHCLEPQEDCECAECNSCLSLTTINETDRLGNCPSCESQPCANCMEDTLSDDLSHHDLCPSCQHDQDEEEEVEDCNNCCDQFSPDEINWQGNCYDCQNNLDEEEEEQEEG